MAHDHNPLQVTIYPTEATAAANEANMRGDTLIRVIMVPGDHFSVFPEVVRRYLALIEDDVRSEQPELKK